MSKLHKLIQRLKNRPRDFTYDELKKILGSLGYKEDSGGRTSGSRVSFIHPETLHVIRLHKPHPGNIFKMYQIDYIVDELSRQNLI